MFNGRKIHANIPRFERNSAIGKLTFRNGRNMDGNNVVVGFHREAGVAAKRYTAEEKFFAEVVLESKYGGTEASTLKISFDFEPAVADRWKKSFVEEVLVPGESFNILSFLEAVGFFAINVFPLGLTFCILEESEEGMINEIFTEGGEWWK